MSSTSHVFFLFQSLSARKTLARIKQNQTKKKFPQNKKKDAIVASQSMPTIVQTCTRIHFRPSQFNLPEVGRISATCRDWSVVVDSITKKRDVGWNQYTHTSSLDAPRVGNSSPKNTDQRFRAIKSLQHHQAKQVVGHCTFLFSNCSIGDASASAIAEAIKQSQSLATVTIQSMYETPL